MNVVTEDKKPWQGHVINYAPYIFIVLLLIIIPFAISSYYLHIITKILIFTLFAMSLNLIFGYGGLFSMGHAAFLGVGGYTAGIFMVRLGIDSFWIIALVAILLSALIAAVFGYISLKVSGLFFLMVTFALAQLLYAVVYNWFDVTGGAFGLKGIPLPNLNIPGVTLNELSFYFFVFIIFIICYFLLYRISNSPFGHALTGIRDNEPRMKAMGYNTWLYKYIAIIISGVFAGIAGTLFASWHTLVSPSQIGVTTSVLALLYVMIGGAGFLFGPLIGAALVILVEYYVSIYLPERWPLVLGILFIVTVMLLRGGIAPYLIRAWKKR